MNEKGQVKADQKCQKASHHVSEHYLKMTESGAL